MKRKIIVFLSVVAVLFGIYCVGVYPINTVFNAYHENVTKAFETASTLASTLAGVSNKVILAHSLGNILTCSAIEDYNMQVDKYFMLNAAVPSEALKASLASTAINGNYMVHEDWGDYLSKTWSSRWYELFDLPDKRAALTWRGRFANVVSNAYNYYSSGDEVFEMFPGMPGTWSGAWDTVLGRRYCWQKQELFKGNEGLGGTEWAGWGFELTVLLTPKYTALEANALTDNQLRTAPVFEKSPSHIFNSNLTKTQIDELLAKAIPALSHATGNTSIPMNHNDQFSLDISTLKSEGWVDRGGDMETNWLHEDLIDMAYLYNFELYDKLVDEGDLDE